MNNKLLGIVILAVLAVAALFYVQGWALVFAGWVLLADSLYRAYQGVSSARRPENRHQWSDTNFLLPVSGMAALVAIACYTQSSWLAFAGFFPWLAWPLVEVLIRDASFAIRLAKQARQTRQIEAKLVQFADARRPLPTARVKELAEWTDTIRKYLDGTMSSEEREEFELKLFDDPDLAEAVDAERLLRAGLTEVERRQANPPQ